MAKYGSTDPDVGHINTATLTAVGATAGVEVPAGQILELAISVPVGVTAAIQCSYDGGLSYFTLTPTSQSVIDATAAAVAVTNQYFTEEQAVKLRAAASGTFGGGTLSFRISGAKRN